MYLLEKELQDGNKIPHWRPQSKWCVNVGLSAGYVSITSLVLNPTTGTIMAQYNLVFDDWFATVDNDGNLLDFDSAEWWDLFGQHSHYSPIHADDKVDESGGPLGELTGKALWTW